MIEQGRHPADRCGCGHVRNLHDRYGAGRCLAGGCRCAGPLGNAPGHESRSDGHG